MGYIKQIFAKIARRKAIYASNQLIGKLKNLWFVWANVDLIKTLIDILSQENVIGIMFVILGLNSANVQES